MFPNLKSVRQELLTRQFSKWAPWLRALSAPADLSSVLRGLSLPRGSGREPWLLGAICGHSFLLGPCWLEGSGETVRDAQGQTRSSEQTERRLKHVK